MKYARKIKKEKLGPTVFGYLEIRGDEDVSPCVCVVDFCIARVASLNGSDQYDMAGYDVDWRIWDQMPNQWERKMVSWQNAEQTRLA